MNENEGSRRRISLKQQAVAVVVSPTCKQANERERELSFGNCFSAEIKNFFASQQKQHFCSSTNNKRARHAKKNARNKRP